MRAAIVGTGNIGTDLMEKMRRCEHLELALFAGVDSASAGIAKAQAYGIATSTDGADAVLGLDGGVDVVIGSGRA
jgi:acetaldehyde dehydrogenase